MSRRLGAAPAGPRPRSRLSLPKEHGAYLTLVGATLAAIVHAGDPLAALGMGLAVGSAFFARAATDRLAGRVGLLAWDGRVLVALFVLAAVGVLLSGRSHAGFAVVAAVLAASLVVGSALVRRARMQRDLALEVAAMGVLGACSGLGAAAGGAPVASAATLAFVLGAHALVAVPLVRTELRRRERARAGPALAVAAFVVIAAAVGIVVVGRPLATLALAPRLAQIVHRALFVPKPERPIVVGVRETIVLAVVVLLAVLTA